MAEDVLKRVKIDASVEAPGRESVTQRVGGAEESIEAAPGGPGLKILLDPTGPVIEQRGVVGRSEETEKSGGIDAEPVRDGNVPNTTPFPADDQVGPY